jgi:hypothetical protein
MFCRSVRAASPLLKSGVAILAASRQNCIRIGLRLRANGTEVNETMPAT